MRRRAIWVSLLLAVNGCADDPGSGPTTGPAGEVTWSGHIRGFVQANCTVCHFTGGSAPFAFETHADVAAFAPAMLDAMSAGRMPPWPADPACNTYDNERLVADADVAQFQAWVDAGSPEGETTEPIVVAATPFTPTATATAASAYTPDLSSAGDDYRCFLLDLDFPADRWVTGSQVQPASEAVHHVLVYALGGSQLDTAEQLDADEAGEGYTCFGGPVPVDVNGGGAGGGGGGNLPTQIAAWVPGSVPNVMPDGLGLPIAAGSRVVMQVHYSAVGGDPVPDQTQLQLLLRETPPEYEIRTVPLAILDIDIPAGQSVTFERTFSNYSDKTVAITSLAGHMHLLGASVSAEHVRAADGDTSCALSIPDWDFDWQLSYALREEVLVAPGDGIRVTCSYDNTAANQPVVDGQQVAPRDVAWGEGSLDEMCLVYATTIAPYSGPPAAAASCGSASDCFAASDGSLTALLACEETEASCVTCSIQAGVQCGLASCLLPLASQRQCVTNCVLATNAFGGSIDACLRDNCADAYTSFLSCADPVFQSGACDGAMASSCQLNP